VDTSGNESQNAAYIVTDLGDPMTANVLVTIDFKALGWPGTLTGGTVSGGDLVANSPGLMWNGTSGTLMWGDDAALMWQGSYAEMIYTGSYAVPIGPQIGSQMTLATFAQGDTVALSYRPMGPSLMWAENTAAAMWSDDAALQWHAPQFIPWPGSVPALADTYEFRIVTGFGRTQGAVTAFTLSFDVPDIVERFNDLVIAAGGTRLSLGQTYTAISNVNLTLQYDGGAAVSAKVMDKDSALGPLIKCFDTTNAATGGKIDAVIQGY